MLHDVSPLFHADRIKKPLMVLQGANDPRVIKIESDDIVAAVKKNGIPVEYLVFADEGHGITKKKNQIDGWGAVLIFLDQHLKGGKAGPDKRRCARREVSWRLMPVLKRIAHPSEGGCVPLSERGNQLFRHVSGSRLNKRAACGSVRAIAARAARVLQIQTSRQVVASGDVGSG